jgi:hypothetical protein
MGCFNTIILSCPECETPQEVQSKGGDCSLKTVPLARASLGDVFYIADDRFVCDHCGRPFGIASQTLFTTVPLSRNTDDDEDD